MAKVHGKNANYSFNGTAIEGELDTIAITFTVAETEITAFNDAWQNFVAGKTNVTEEISGTYSADASATTFGADALLDAIGGGPVTTVYDPSGSGPDTNDPEYTCTASGLTGSLVSSMRLNFPVGGKAEYSASIQNSGATTRAVS